MFEYPLSRICIASSSSGSGKTTLTCGILRALMNRGYRPAAFKCGPDYIDPLFHREAVGAFSSNLDLFFCNEEAIVRLLHENTQAGDIAVLEGVMGFYDGLGGTTTGASTWRLAQATDTPVILVENCAGLSVSVAARIKGLAVFREDSHIHGVVLNRVKEKLYPALKALIEKETGITVLGRLPFLEDCVIESRHLGLVTPEELGDLKEKIGRLARRIEQDLDMDAIIRLAQSAPPLTPAGGGSPGNEEDPSSSPFVNDEGPGVSVNPLEVCCASRIKPPKIALEAIFYLANSVEPKVRSTPVNRDFCGADGAKIHKCNRLLGNTGDLDRGCGISLFHPITGAKTRPRLGIARDRAFCFYYEDSLNLLKKLGAELVFFSPLHDRRLPAGLNGLYLGGGYPELYGAPLADNQVMREDIRKALESGMPCIAECGGFMYLHRTLVDAQGIPYPLAGFFPGSCVKKDHPVRFGYAAYTAKSDNLLCPRGGVIRGHEFHYWDSDNPGDDFIAIKPVWGETWPAAVATAALYAGFPHLYLYSVPSMARRFLERCKTWRTSHE
ncbi:MAG: cobyrinate a,c-diamide synthase [Spirochaetaceae bacterium]|nr:cobyrinate a,c-diamide synthase [Spirochaetaceae bacterium]